MTACGMRGFSEPSLLPFRICRWCARTLILFWMRVYLVKSYDSILVVPFMLHKPTCKEYKTFPTISWNNLQAISDPPQKKNITKPPCKSYKQVHSHAEDTAHPSLKFHWKNGKPNEHWVYICEIFFIAFYQRYEPLKYIWEQCNNAWKKPNWICDEVGLVSSWNYFNSQSKVATKVHRIFLSRTD